MFLHIACGVRALRFPRNFLAVDFRLECSVLGASFTPVCIVMPATDLPVWTMGMLRIIKDHPWSLDAQSLLRPHELAHASGSLHSLTRLLPQQHECGVFRIEGTGRNVFKETINSGMNDCALVTRHNHTAAFHLRRGNEDYKSYIIKRRRCRNDAMSAIYHYELALRKVISAVSIPEEDGQSPLRLFDKGGSKARYATSKH